MLRFLVDPADPDRHVEGLTATVSISNRVIIAAFALDEPKDCGGLPMQRYGPEALNRTHARTTSTRQLSSKLDLPGEDEGLRGTRGGSAGDLAGNGSESMSVVTRVVPDILQADIAA